MIKQLAIDTYYYIHRSWRIGRAHNFPITFIVKEILLGLPKLNNGLTEYF